MVAYKRLKIAENKPSAPGGHRFQSCRGLRFFLGPALATCWLKHLQENKIPEQLGQEKGPFSEIKKTQLVINEVLNVWKKLTNWMKRWIDGDWAAEGSKQKNNKRLTGAVRPGIRIFVTWKQPPPVIPLPTSTIVQQRGSIFKVSSAAAHYCTMQINFWCHAGQGTIAWWRKNLASFFCGEKKINKSKSSQVWSATFPLWLIEDVSISRFLTNTHRSKVTTT